MTAPISPSADVRTSGRRPAIDAQLESTDKQSAMDRLADIPQHGQLHLWDNSGTTAAQANENNQRGKQ